MQIAIVGFNSKLCGDVERFINAIIKEDSEIVLNRHDIEKRVKPIPQDVCAVFVVVDSIKAMNWLHSIASWSEGRPVVVVSNHPQYAIEGIRHQVKHYLLFPLVDKDMREAMNRAGLSEEVKPIEKYSYI
ncbi:MAG: hypothetical protein LBS19_02105 [Clostridiales bacterium]|nr:hypothetical protein [Clostridiales bacterium]